MKGRKPIPTEILKTKGTFNSTRQGGRQNADIPISIEMPPPDDLIEPAKRLWAEVVPYLLKANIITPLDIFSLKALINCYALYEILIQSINGKVFSIVKGKKVVKPEVKEARLQLEQYNKMCSDFGMNPVSRARLHVEPAPPADPLADLL